MHIENVIANIADTLRHEIDGEQIAKIHNDLCAKKIHYNGDSCFNEMQIDDNQKCIFCGQECWDGELCDEQQAGGFNADKDN